MFLPNLGLLDRTFLPHVVIMLSLCLVVSGSNASHLLIDKHLIVDEVPFGVLIWNRYSEAGAFRKYQTFSLLNCVTECLVRIHCLAFSYHRSSLSCVLLGSDDELNLKDSEGFVFSHISSWPQIYLGQCIGRKCSKNKKCSVRNGTVVCQTSECGEPRHIPNAIVLPGYHGVGDMRNYTRAIRFDHHLPINSTCMTNGEWSYPDISCKPNCEPPTNIPHASLHMHTGTKFGSTAIWKCEAGYRPDFVTGQCADFGEWNYSSSCMEMDCGPPANISHVLLRMNNGSTVTWQCEDGYGPDFVTGDCTANVTWNYSSKCDRSNWCIEVHISDILFAGSDVKISIDIFGTHGNETDVRLNNNENNLDRGGIDTFCMNFQNFGFPNASTLRNYGGRLAPGVHFAKVIIRDQFRTFEFPVNYWLLFPGSISLCCGVNCSPAGDVDNAVLKSGRHDNDICSMLFC